MADRKKRFRIGLVALVAISLLVCPLAAGGFGLGGANAQIAFTPNIATLEVTRTVEGPRLELGATVQPGVTPAETHIPVTDGAWIVQGLTSDEALSRCTQHWGDEQRGMCLAPGGATYYVWIEPGAVMEVVIDTAQPWQEHFRAAVSDIVTDLGNIRRETTVENIGALGLIGGGLGIIACIPSFGLGCIAAAVVGGAGAWAVAATGENLRGYNQDLCTHSRGAVFNYCMMRGNDDATCREAAGYGTPCPTERGRCNPRTPCMP